MDIENQEIIYCADDEEYRVYCNIYDKLCIKRFQENHLTSQSHTNIIYERQRLNKTNKKN